MSYGTAYGGEGWSYRLNAWAVRVADLRGVPVSDRRCGIFDARARLYRRAATAATNAHVPEDALHGLCRNASAAADVRRRSGRCVDEAVLDHWGAFAGPPVGPGRCCVIVSFVLLRRTVPISAAPKLD